MNTTGILQNCTGKPLQMLNMQIVSKSGRRLKELHQMQMEGMVTLSLLFIKKDVACLYLLTAVYAQIAIFIGFRG